MMVASVHLATGTHNPVSRAATLCRSVYLRSMRCLGARTRGALPTNLSFTARGSEMNKGESESGNKALNVESPAEAQPLAGTSAARNPTPKRP